MAAKIDLTALAFETTDKLAFVWNLIGVPEEERQQFLAELAEKVKAQYNGALSSQQERQAALEKEIEELQNRITFLQESTDQSSEGLPPGEHLSLTAYRDLLESTRSRAQGLWDGREGELKALLADLTAACSRVAEVIPAGYEEIGPKMTLTRIAAYKSQLSSFAKLQAEREGKIGALTAEIAELWEEIEGTPSEQEDKYSHKAVTGGVAAVTAAFGWGEAVIVALQERLSAVQADVEAREAKIEALGQQLTHYWNRLQVSAEEQASFLSSNSGISDATLSNVESAIAAMKAEFQARLTELVGKARANITACWDEMRAGEQQRKEMFPSLFLTPGQGNTEEEEGSFYTEELFSDHESYLSHLKAALEDMRPILRGLEKRDELLRDRTEYLQIISDPSRLLARGSSAARLKEEKLEKRVKKELPAVLKKLREQVKEWETATGRPFLVDDKRFIETLDEEDAKEAKEKGEARAARHGGGAAASADASSGSSSSSSSSAAAGSKAVDVPSGRSTSNGRAATVAGATKASLSGTLSRKPSATAATLAPSTASASAAAGSEEGVSSENAPAAAAAAAAAVAAAPIVATKRALGSSSSLVSAPAVPLKDCSSTASVAAAGAATGKTATLRIKAAAVGGAAATTKAIEVSAESKASAAKMLGNL